MFEPKKVKVTIVKSIAGEADPQHDHERPFAYQPGQHVELNPELAKAWIKSGIAKPFGAVNIEELIELKMRA